MPASTSKLASRFLLALAVYPLAALIALALIPGDSKNAFWLGFSLQRLLLMAVALAGVLISIALAVLAGRNAHLWQRRLEPIWGRLSVSRWLLWLAGLLAVQGAVAVFLPAYWLGTGHAYYERLRPILIWLGAAGLQIALGIQITRSGWHGAALRSEIRSLHSIWRVAAIAFGVFALLWLLSALTGWGARPDILWNEAAPPILAVQLALSLLIALVLGALLRRIEPVRRRRAEWFIALALWALAVFIWVREPMPRSYFAPGPYPPNDVYYPYSDAASYDVSAQYVLLGQPLDSTAPNEKPVYGAFLTVLHLLAGQSYDLVTLIQVLVLALFPVILFRLGRHFHLEAGLLVALLAIFKERNAIAATLSIRVSHSRLLLTEFPTALFVALICWLLVEYLAAPDRRRLLPLAIGGWLGLGAMLRLNLLALVPMIIVLVVLAFWRRPRAAWLFSLILIVSLAIPMIPWSAATSARWGQPAWVMKLKMVLDSRYAAPTLTPTANPQPQATPLPATEAQPAPASTPTPVATPVPQPAPLSQQSEICVGKTGLAEILCFAPAHWAHNNLMAVLTLPHTLAWEDLPHTLPRDYWLDIRSWNGRLAADEAILMILNLALVALGIGFAWHRRRWGGLAPLAFMQIYFVANALGRTSGGRYLTPVDWAIYFYAALGLCLIVDWVRTLLGFPAAPEDARPAAPAARRFPWFLAAALLLAFLIPALALPFMQRAFPAQLTSPSQSDLLDRLNTSGALTQMDFSSQQVSDFAGSPEAILVTGRGLYPRFYGINQGEPDSQATPQFAVRPYPRLLFTLLTAQQPRVVELPVNVPPEWMPDAADWIVLGCQNLTNQRIDAIALIQLTDPPQVILRSPAAALTCPLPEPVCDNNRNCK
ncbi:MAG TPA: hypothetical protein PLT26_14145 [Anaerolineaceae bacterium]|nr:hypothetical protein [Anaerolineaceae bacterium]HQH86679.1 hypothetical protein [Anaerolineaceae bacterium]